MSPKRHLSSGGRALASGGGGSSSGSSTKRSSFNAEGCAVRDIVAGQLLCVERPSLYSGISELHDVINSEDYKKLNSDCCYISLATLTSADHLPLLDYAWFGKLTRRCREGYTERVQQMCSRLLTYAEHEVDLHLLEGDVEFTKTLVAVCQHYRFELQTQVGPMSTLLSANDLATVMWLRRVAVCSPSGKPLAYALFGKSLFRVRHSCEPNCRLFVDPVTTKGYLRSVRSIKVHEPLTISYVDVRQSHAQRSKSISRFRGYLRCRCALCEQCGCKGEDDPCERCATLDARTQDLLVCGSARTPDYDHTEFPLLSNAPSERVLIERLQSYADSPSKKHIDQLLVLSATHGNTCPCSRCLVMHLALANCYCMHREKVLALKHYGLVQKILRSENALYYEPELRCIASNIEAITTESRQRPMYCGWKPYLIYLEEKVRASSIADMCLPPTVRGGCTSPPSILPSGSDPNLSRARSKSCRLSPKRHSGPRLSQRRVQQYASTQRL